jgi:hypothetical protein
MCINSLGIDLCDVDVKDLEDKTCLLAKTLTKHSPAQTHNTHNMCNVRNMYSMLLTHDTYHAHNIQRVERIYSNFAVKL